MGWLSTMRIVCWLVCSTLEIFKAMFKKKRNIEHEQWDWWFDVFIHVWLVIQSQIKVSTLNWIIYLRMIVFFKSFRELQIGVLISVTIFSFTHYICVAIILKYSQTCYEAISVKQTYTLLLSYWVCNACTYCFPLIPHEIITCRISQIQSAEQKQIDIIFGNLSFYKFTFIMNVQIHITLLKFRMLVETLQALPRHGRE